MRRGLTEAFPTAAHAVRHPLASVADAARLAGSVGRFVQPVFGTLSPVMTERSLDRHLDMVAVELDDLKRAAEPWEERSTMPSWPR